MQFTLAALAVILPMVSAFPSPSVNVTLGAPAFVDAAQLESRDAAADRTNSLNAHNAARKAVGVPNLVWDSGLQSAAQDYANHLASINQLVHGSSGENLYWSSAYSDHDLLSATQAWVNEKPNYHGEAIPDGNFASYGHYTQVVWRSTTKVGVAAARDSKGGVYVVARYSPVGNYVGQKPY